MMQEYPEQVRRRIARLPIAAEPVYEVLPPNPATLLFSGWFQLRQGRKVTRVRGRLTYRWLARPGIYFEATSSIRSPALDLAEAELLIKSPRTRTQVEISQKTLGKKRRYSGRGKGLTILGSRRDARRVRFHLLNFHSFIGGMVRRGTAETAALSRARLTLKAYGLRISVDQLPDCRDRLQGASAQGGFALTHVGLITRPKGQYLKFASVQSILFNLNLFFGLLRGSWCGPVIPTADGKTTQLWTGWANWKLTPWKSTQSWFPRLKAQETGALYRDFELLMRKALWRRVLRSTLNWYVLANAEARSTEAKIVPAFIALEMLAWALLVEDRGRMSNRRFNGLSAANKIHSLLHELHIPSDIPARFTRLKPSASRRKLRSGPEILGAVRNALVHPKQSKRRFLARLHYLTLWELSQLALTYLELAHLALLHYRGPYVRRVFPGYEEEAMTTVPWS